MRVISDKGQSGEIGNRVRTSLCKVFEAISFPPALGAWEDFSGEFSYRELRIHGFTTAQRYRGSR